MKSIKNISLILLLVSTTHCFAASAPGTIATTLASQVDAWYVVVRPLINKVALAFALVGGLLVFIHYAQGNDQAPKMFTKALIGLGIFALSATIIEIFVD